MNSLKIEFETGELYLFHTSDRRCPSESSLWGIVAGRKGGCIRLENSSRNLQTFHLWHNLPRAYRFCRLATRAELSDYMYNLCWFECHSSLQPSCSARFNDPHQDSSQ